MLTLNLDNWRRERFIRKTLRRVARQRVAIVAPHEGPWVIEFAVSEGHEPDVTEALRTCHLRGWVDVLADRVPTAQLGPQGELPRSWAGTKPIYRLTEAGWAEIRRTHDWVVATFLVSLLALVAAVAALYIAPRP